MFKRESLSFLPKKKQTDLEMIAGMIKGGMEEAGMAILFGSYARNDYVDFDRRIDFKESKTYQSDYDILILSHNVDIKIAKTKISVITNRYYARKQKEQKKMKEQGTDIHITPLRIIHKDIEGFNKEISDNKYFSVQIKNEGIIILDKDIYKLSQPRELNYKELQSLAQEYHDFHFSEVEKHLKGSELFIKENIYNLSAYHLQQALEHIYHSILLVFKLDSPKNHNLAELNNSVYPFTPAVSECFGSPEDNEFTKECFDLIDKAYIEGRYNPDYIITNVQLLHSREKILTVAKLAFEANLAKIEKYGELFEKEKK